MFSGLGILVVILPTQSVVSRSLLNFDAIWSTSWDILISGLRGRHLEFQLPHTLDAVVSITTRMSDPENMVLAFWISMLSGLQAEWDILTSGLGGRHLEFQLPLTSDAVESVTTRKPDPEIIMLAFEILMLSGLPTRWDKNFRTGESYAYFDVPFLWYRDFWPYR